MKRNTRDNDSKVTNKKNAAKGRMPGMEDECVDGGYILNAKYKGCDETEQTGGDEKKNKKQYMK